MANRHITRRILLGAAVSIFLLFVFFVRPQGPPSPAIRAPGHLEKASHSTLTKDDMVKGEVVMPKLGNETAKYVTYTYWFGGF